MVSNRLAYRRWSPEAIDRKSTRLNSSHSQISYAVFCLKKKTFTDVSAQSGILKPGPRYSITAVSYDFDNDGWPDIYVAVDSEPSILFHNNHDGTFTDVA